MTDALETMLQMAVKVGVDAGQMRNFASGFYAPLPWTLAFHAAARDADETGGPDEIGIGGARGPGKSHAIFAQTTLDDCQRFAGIKCLYLRKIGKGAREQLDDLRQKVLFAVPHQYRRNEGLIQFENNSRIIAGNFQYERDIEQYLGMEYEIIIVEELTTLTSTKHQALRDSNRSSVPNMRPRMYNSTNPGGVGHAWYKKRFVIPYRTGQEMYTRFFPATVDDNPFIDAGYRRRLEENTGWRLRAYRYGEWDIAAGSFFDTFREDVHVQTPYWTSIPETYSIWLSMDYGYHHLTVVHLLARSPDGVILHVDEHISRRTPVEVQARSIRLMLAKWGIGEHQYNRRIRKFVAGADVFAKSDEDLTVADHFRKQGFHLTAAHMDRTNGWANMLAYLGDVERDIKPRWFIFNTCPRLIESLPILEHDPKRPEDIIRMNVDDDGYGGDDAADCARYGLMENVLPITLLEADTQSSRWQIQPVRKPTTTSSTWREY
jgi:phage terminase large subunit